MQTIDAIIAAEPNRDARDIDICALIGVSKPGAYAIREPDGRLMVWATEDDSWDDDGTRATYRSREAISDEAWAVVQALAWVEGHRAGKTFLTQRAPKSEG